ncbi:hypothetical protein, partial [Nocardioides sp. AE5]|uniref:hypothetical protein n=1 Tax=Nocardioides sp. AE5 TaxID=2962573 RepID=UPI002880CEDE
AGVVAGLWQATVFDASGQQWQASNDDPSGVDGGPSIELTDGHAVVDGTWSAVDGNGHTRPIRVELVCPSSGN